MNGRQAAEEMKICERLGSARRGVDVLRGTVPGAASGLEAGGLESCGTSTRIKRPGGLSAPSSPPSASPPRHRRPAAANRGLTRTKSGVRRDSGKFRLRARSYVASRERRPLLHRGVAGCRRPGQGLCGGQGGLRPPLQTTGIGLSATLNTAPLCAVDQTAN